VAQLRQLALSDLPDLMALSISVGWNQVEDDWRRLLMLEPEGCFGIEEGGRVCASATALTYGRELAWIGMVLTLPDSRGRGFATRLLKHCLEYCGTRGVKCIKLDATDLGRPVYEKLGFVEEYIVERWKGTLAAAEKQKFEHDPALDREAFGADRSALLASVGMCRPGRVASFVGPIVTRTSAEARERVVHCGLEGTVFWDLPHSNPAALELARSLGFAQARRLWRMRRGAPISERPEYVYALAGFEFG